MLYVVFYFYVVNCVNVNFRRLRVTSFVEERERADCFAIEYFLSGGGWVSGGVSSFSCVN